MFKIIILPNKTFFPYGNIFKFEKKIKENLCEFFINNSININNYCGFLGKCNSCQIFINENSFISNVFYKSCELKGVSNNFIITIF